MKQLVQEDVLPLPSESEVKKSLSPKDDMNEFFSLLFEAAHDIFNIGSSLLFYKFFRTWFSWFLYPVSTSFLFFFVLSLQI